MNLLELFKKYEDNDNAIVHLESIRWKNGIICPYCNSEKIYTHHVSYGEKIRKRWQCGSCSRPFTVTVGTIFHHSHIHLNKWFWLISLMLNAKKGLSACQAARDLGMRRPTVWSMMHRIRKAMGTEQAELLQGIVEMDECYIGGKPRKGDHDEDNKPKRGRGTKKIPVVGILEREGEVRIESANKISLNSKNLMDLVRKYINPKQSVLMTDQYLGYTHMAKIVPHAVINHSFEYVRGNIHTNTIESFWAILKRGIIGQYHKVSEKYLQNYLHEFEFRYNRRKQEVRLTFEETLQRMMKA
jgi:transposase-like protein